MGTGAVIKVVDCWTVRDGNADDRYWPILLKKSVIRLAHGGRLY
jgi:hypothetical protein